MVLYHWSQSTRLVREGALGPLSFIYERQYTEQLVDNQQEQKTVNLAELKHSVQHTRISVMIHNILNRYSETVLHSSLT